MIGAYVESMKNRNPVRVVGIGIALFIILFLPFITDEIAALPYRSVFKGMTFGLAAVGVAILLRYFQLVSFGHAAFFGSGAYMVAVLTSHYEISNMFVLLFAAVVVAAVLAAVIGLLVKSHLAIFFALLTLAFNQVIYAFVKSQEFFNYTDGLSVRMGADRPDVFGIQLELGTYDLFMHYLTVFLLIGALYVAWKLANSPFGRTIDAIGQNRARAEFIGIRVERYVWVTFVITGIYAGIGGALYALFELHVRPDSTLHIFRSGEMLFMAILGGIESIIGPVVGGIVLTYLLDTMHVYTEHFDLTTGIILIAVVFLLPKGIVGTDYSIKLRNLRKNPRDLDILQRIKP